MKTQKELKDEYKQMKFPIGVFQIRNLSSNKVLVDSSTDMLSKWNRHKSELRFGGHRNRELQKDWNETGESNFCFEIISELKHGDTNAVTAADLKLLLQMTLEEMNLSEDMRY
jgi:hypothetical protein